MPIEDLICPECGRPNLSEAKKCWYCQTELIQPASTESENQPETTDIHTTGTDLPEENHPQEEIEENIPEWLLKIRKRIESDRDPEEELPYWKQKDIFGGEKKIKDKTAKDKKSKRTKKSAQPKLDFGADEDQDPSHAPKQAGEIGPEKIARDNTNDDLSDELPDGFVKL